MTDDDTPRPLSAERSNLVAAVYGDGTPPTWFTDALGRFEAAARASAGPAPLDEELLAEALDFGLAQVFGYTAGAWPLARLASAEYARLAAARLPAAGHTHRQLWCERNESSASAHGHDDGCYHDHLRDSADSAPTPAAPGESE